MLDNYRELVEPERWQAEALLAHADQLIIEAEQAWLQMAQDGSA